MPIAVFDLGTNIDREESLATALAHLTEQFELKRASSVYRSLPVGMAAQPDFFNISLEVQTDLPPEDIPPILRSIEDQMGRDRNAPKFGPRNIDIDLILYGDLVCEDLSLPHPQCRSELFVVSPLAELYPDGSHPKTGESWRDLNRSLLAEQTGKEPVISRQFPVTDLPLTSKVQDLLSP